MQVCCFQHPLIFQRQMLLQNGTRTSLPQHSTVMKPDLAQLAACMFRNKRQRKDC